MTAYRLYLVDRETGKSTGKKRDYPSEEHFIKYGIKTYNSYNRVWYCNGWLTNERAKLCFLNENLKWEEVSPEKLKQLLNGKC